VRHASLVCGAVVLVVACTPPIEVRRVSPRQAQRRLTSNVLTSGDLSPPTQNLLYDRDLIDRYVNDPAGALATLHGDFVAGRLQPTDAASLAELSFRYAGHGGGSPYYLASAVYSWAYLFPRDPGANPRSFDPRVRLACDLYNRGITQGLKRGENVDVGGGTYPLPFGTLDLAVDRSTLAWGGHQLIDFYPVADLEVKGFPTYYRWPGLGAPLAARVVPKEGEQDLLAPRLRVPVTAVLRPTDPSRRLGEGDVQATLELHPGYGGEVVKVGTREVPLEAEPTAALALTLAETDVWQRETAGFLQGHGVITEKTRLVSTRPYQPGLIPVVFVHGTGSSIARWAALYNDLDNDPRIHDHYQFWAFSYETGNPILYSAMLLREALQRAITQLDPEGQDLALHRMVVIGHSQGGLLTKATVVESGDTFWATLSNKPIDEVKLSDRSRDLLRRALFIHPLPFVRTVVFVATPHRGSYVAGGWLAHQVKRLVSIPLDVSRVMTEFATLDRQALTVEGLRGAPTAVDNMTPSNRFVQALSQLSIAPGVTAHSIIAVEGTGPPQGQNDGVVEYDSAHIDGVASELVVRSAHSCQSNPHTIAEVRRVLLENLGCREDPPAPRPEVHGQDSR
jgi:pimeloyl-ACP methyl ester carboxylesterase